MRTPRRASPQRGAALLTAMIILALVATLAASMLWQQWRAIQVEAAERSRQQSSWILAGALDWARLILREDGRTARTSPNGAIDHLGEPWAVPLAEARLSTFLAADQNNTEDAPDAFLSGSITDATARFNLTNLVNGNKIDPTARQTLERLCQTVGVSADVAARIAAGMRDAAPPSPPETPASGASAPATAPPTSPEPPPAADPPLMPAQVQQLVWFGIDREAVRALEPYVVILPEKTSVNVNTASREVIAAVIPNLDLATAERIVQARQRTPIKSAIELQALAPQTTAGFPGIAYGTTYFEIRGRLRLGDVVLEQRSLVQRSDLSVVVKHRERVSSRDQPVS